MGRKGDTRALAGRGGAIDGGLDLGHHHKEGGSATFLQSASRLQEDTVLPTRMTAPPCWNPQTLPPLSFESAAISQDLQDLKDLQYLEDREEKATYLPEKPVPARPLTAAFPPRRQSIVLVHSRRASQEPEPAEPLTPLHQDAPSRRQPLIASHTERQPRRPHSSYPNPPQPAAAITLADPTPPSGAVARQARGQTHPAEAAGNIAAAIPNTTADRQPAAGQQPGLFGRLLRRASTLHMNRKPAKQQPKEPYTRIAEAGEREAPEASRASQAKPALAPASAHHQQPASKAPARVPPPPQRPQTAFVADSVSQVRTSRSATGAMPPPPLRRKPSLMDRLRLRSSGTPAPQEQPPHPPVKRAAYVPKHAASDFSRLDPKVREGHQFYSGTSRRHSRILDNPAAHDRFESELRRLALASSDVAEEEPAGNHSQGAAAAEDGDVQPPGPVQPSQPHPRQASSSHQRNSDALRVDPHRSCAANDQQNTLPQHSRDPFSTSPVTGSKMDEDVSPAARTSSIDTCGEGGNYTLNASAVSPMKVDGENNDAAPSEANTAEARQPTDYEIFVRRAAEKEEQELRRRALAAQGNFGSVPVPQLPPPNPFYWHSMSQTPRLGGIEEDQDTGSSAGGTTAVNPHSSRRSRSNRNSSHSHTAAAAGTAFQEQQQQQRQPWQRHAKRSSWTPSFGPEKEEEVVLVGDRGVAAVQAAQPRALRRKSSITQRIAEYVRPTRESVVWSEGGRR